MLEIKKKDIGQKKHPNSIAKWKKESKIDIMNKGPKKPTSLG